MFLAVTLSSMSSLCSQSELPLGLFWEGGGGSHIPDPGCSKGSSVHKDSVAHLNSDEEKREKNPEL